MKLAGRSRLEVPRERAWARLSDPRTLEEVLPTVESVELIDADSFTVRIEPATGLGVTALEVELTISDKQENEHVRLRGTGRGGEYAVSFTVELDFEADDDASTVHWSAEAKVDGVLGSLGQRVLPAILSAQIDQVLRAAGESSSTATR